MTHFAVQSGTGTREWLSGKTVERLVILALSSVTLAWWGFLGWVCWRLLFG
jgi:hypothetical protein